ncbi:hypothetical protein BVK86_00690 [Pseudomonas reinekei]|uniref:Uncharacterized protein n=1 Tax=Pseudomonas reinekei TaxID=395598 RepID=A0A1Q9X4C5_PSERE|nr:hypothetical protein BVK86_00690 [Pseudomonas reinekei]
MRRARFKDALKRIKTSVRAVLVDNHHDSATSIGPLVSRAQVDRAQHFIRWRATTRTESIRSINGETNLLATLHPALRDFQPLSTLALGK